MPVYKYRSIEEMPESWEIFGDRNIARRLRSILSMVRGMPLGLPRGVRKFRSVDELVAERDAYENARIHRSPKS